MTKPKSKHPLTSFDSSLLDALIQGGTKPVRLQCPDAKTATHYRHRLHTLRAAMRREERQDWEQFYRAGIAIDPGDPTVLLIQPRDFELRKIIEAAGVPLTGDGAPPVSGMDTKSATSEEIEQFLKDLKTLK